MASRFRFRFFDLPAELREAILANLVLLPSSISALRPVSRDDEARPPAILADLLLVCSQMYQEVSAIFYTQNRFHIDLGPRTVLDQLTEEGQLLSAQGQDARRRIRNLTLRMRRIGGDFERHIVPALSDMILCGSLRNLEINILSQSRGRQKMSCTSVLPMQGGPNPLEATGLFHTSPFQALLRLLADPDLERVDFLVSPFHWALWCPFHEPLEGIGSCGSKLMQRENQYARVDWRQMVEAWGGGVQIAKVH
ncbi:hypothetical protein BJ170DRAFT_629221 [Xylariales sp. AK1849]|nr:hypothetical protein BJ170DRAFT_629221 [Xylariales sp. AK1849]